VVVDSKLSIVIATYNRYKDLVECLISLFKMDYQPFEIIIVDSRSTDETETVEKNYPVRYISIKEKNRQRARNVGSRLAEGNVVAFLDDDVLVHRKWSKHLLAAYKHPQIGGVGGRVIPYGMPESHYQKVRKDDVGKIFKTGLVTGNYDIPLESPVEVDSLLGCNMSFRKDVMRKVGGFDENFSGNCFRDDTDYCVQTRKHSYKLIYQPKALVWHKFKGKTTSPQWVYWYTRNNTYFYFKDVFSQSRLRFALFFYRMFFPPRDYVLKSGIKVKLKLTTFALALKGIMDGINVYRTTRPNSM